MLPYQTGCWTSDQRSVSQCFSLEDNKRVTNCYHLQHEDPLDVSLHDRLCLKNLEKECENEISRRNDHSFHCFRK